MDQAGVGRTGWQDWGLRQEQPAGGAVKPASLNPRAGTGFPEAGLLPESWPDSGGGAAS